MLYLYYLSIFTTYLSLLPIYLYYLETELGKDILRQVENVVDFVLSTEKVADSTEKVVDFVLE